MTEVEKIRAYIKSMAEFTAMAVATLEIYNKNIKKHLVKKLETDISTEASRREAMSRLSTVNVLPKVVNKLAKSANRAILSSAGRQAQVDLFAEELKLDRVRSLSAKMLNLHGCVLRQINGVGVVGQKPFVRVISADKFLVYSNDEVDPLNVTHVILSYSSTYEVYTADNRKLTLARTGEDYTEEPYPNALLQFNYLSRDTTDLMPQPAHDDYELVTLLPLLLTDANYALKYQAFSVIYTINAKAKEMTLAPSAVWNFDSTGEEGDKPAIGTITPTSDTASVVRMLELQYQMWLQSKGIKSSGISSKTESLSGIAKWIDEGDVTEDIGYQRSLLAPAEAALFKVLGIEDVKLSFEPDPIQETPTERQTQIVERLTNKLVTHEQAIKEANVHLPEDLVQTMIEELTNEDDVSGEGAVQPDEAGQADTGRLDSEENSGQDESGGGQEGEPVPGL